MWPFKKKQKVEPRRFSGSGSGRSVSGSESAPCDHTTPLIVGMMLGDSGHSHHSSGCDHSSHDSGSSDCGSSDSGGGCDGGGGGCDALLWLFIPACVLSLFGCAVSGGIDNRGGNISGNVTNGPATVIIRLLVALLCVATLTGCQTRFGRWYAKQDWTPDNANVGSYFDARTGKPDSLEFGLNWNLKPDNKE